MEGGLGLWREKSARNDGYERRARERYMGVQKWEEWKMRESS